MTSGTLRLANRLTIPMAQVMAVRGGQRIAIIGKSGSGKTNTLKVLAKEWLINGWPCVIVDPMNAYRQLRDSGLPIVVAGTRKSADLIITSRNASVLAEFSFREKVAVALDVSDHEPGEDLAVIKAYLEHLWKLIRAQDEDAPHQPYGVMIDEAHLYVPQSGKTDVTGLLIDMGKRGRQLNLSMVFLTQRPAAIQKEVLTQANLLIAHKVTFGDVNVVADASSQSPKVIREAMKGLAAGEALISGDVDLVSLGGEDFIHVIMRNWEYVSKEANPVGAIDPAVLEALRNAMSKSGDFVREVSMDEVRRLRARVAELEAEVIKLRAQGRREELSPPHEITYQSIEAKASARVVAVPVHTPVVTEAQPVNGHHPNGNWGVEILNAGAKRILGKMADIYPMVMTRKQIATLTNYTESGGTFQANWTMLKRNGLVEERDDLVQIAMAGFRYLKSEPRPIPATTDELMGMWREVLNPREYEMLDILRSAHPETMLIEYLAATVNMTVSGGAFNGYLSTLRRNKLIFASKGEVWVNAVSLAMEVE